MRVGGVGDDIENEFDFITDDNWDPVDAGCEIKTNHEVSGFSFYSVSDYFGTNFKRYRGPKAGEVFLKWILEEKNRMMKIINTIEPMNLSMSQTRRYHAATSCHICEEPLLGEDDVKGWKVIMALSKRYSLIKFIQVQDH